MKPNKASKSEPEDFISNMPENVVANIMDRLPLQDAVRTGILSRNWRFKWNLLSKLVIDQNFFMYLRKKGKEKSLWKIIVMILLRLKGPVKKFVLSSESVNDEDTIECVLFLSKNGVKDLTIQNFNPWSGLPLKLPIYFFSCLELKRLKLLHCCFDPPTSFHGFPNLLSLEMNQVQFKRGKFWELCPALEMLKMFYPYQTSKVKPAEFGKLANLKILSLFLCNLDDANSNSIFELLGFLPKLQNLSLDLINCKLTDGAKKTCPTTFPSIKTLNLSTIDLGNGVMLSFAFQMIRSFPNLLNLEIKACEKETVPTPGTCFPEADDNTMGSLQLRSLVFRDLKGSENEVSLIKYLVTRSPFLKNVVIHPHSRLAPGEQLRFAGKLLKLQRAYPVVDISL